MLFSREVSSQCSLGRNSGKEELTDNPLAEIGEKSAFRRRKRRFQLGGGGRREGDLLDVTGGLRGCA